MLGFLKCTDSKCGPADGATVDVADGSSNAPTDPRIENPTDPKCLDDNKALLVSGPNGNDQTGSGSCALLNNPSDPKCLDESTALFVSGSTGVMTRLPGAEHARSH